jgi:UDP-N-acetylglucosamine diphosphorylase / glucose-1-phosphate thymidylyltransferase / UDP-N-acetylgalactosamine diphosphorylase / glucosamine-1-phosphate N-acetyltransferase / galactosamine-1-phosphate N-acetyltransferase
MKSIINIKFDLPKSSEISPEVTIHPTALISGPVKIGSGTVISEYVVIVGPCIIGKNVHVGSFCKIRPETVLEDEVKLENQVEIKHSHIGKGTHLHSGYVGDSVIGEDCRIGAGFITANRRLDRKNIKIILDGQIRDTDSSYFGCIIGNRVKIGIHCGTNPGVVIPDESVILPMTMISNSKLINSKP